jgi:hypothetical protein
MKLRLRLVLLNISGSGLRSIEPKHRQINTFRLIYLSSERTMLVANVQYQQTAEHGIHRPVNQFLDVEHHHHHHHIHSSFEKSIIIERTIQSNTSKIELKDLMIIFHLERRSVS